MPAITDGEIRELASFKGSTAPVTSFYLDVDGRRRVRHTDVVHQVEYMLRDGRARSAGIPSVLDDFRRIAEFVKGGLDRSHVRGLAIFSCSADSLWRVVQLPVSVRDQLVINHTPSVRQLELVIDEYERFGVLLADRQRARMFVFELGELVESEDHFDQLPRGDDNDHSYTKDQIQDHTSAVTAQHLRNAAAVAWRVYQSQEFDRLILGGPAEIAAELESLLHPYLRDRVEAHCSIPVGASDEEIRSAALQVEADVERRAEAEAVARLRDAAGSGRRGVIGLDATLDALAQRRVDLLLVSSGYVARGWRCGNCGHVARVGRTCPICRHAMHEVDDVVEEMVEAALGQSCRVEVCIDNADLDVLGRIGALLPVLTPTAGRAAATTVGVDVGGTKVLGVALAADGTVTAEVRHPTPRGDEALIATVLAAVAEVRTADTRAVGVGLPGLVDRAGILRFGPNLPGVVEAPVGPRVAEATGLVVRADNDATCATWAEHVSGAGRGVSDLLVATLGTGIGGGLVLEGRLARGANGFAGEIGHMVVDHDGVACVCGRRGCWERYASGSGLGRMAREAAEAGRGTRMIELAGGDPGLVRGEHATAAALEGDPEALTVMRRLAGWVGLGLASLVHILDVRRIVIGGGLVEAGDTLLEPVRAAFTERLFAPEHRPEVEIVAAALGERAGAIGAALLAREA